MTPKCHDWQVRSGSPFHRHFFFNYPLMCLFGSAKNYRICFTSISATAEKGFVFQPRTGQPISPRNIERDSLEPILAQINQMAPSSHVFSASYSHSWLALTESSILESILGLQGIPKINRFSASWLPHLKVTFFSQPLSRPP
jgi:hypothetical protein